MYTLAPLCSVEMPDFLSGRLWLLILAGTVFLLLLAVLVALLVKNGRQLKAMRQMKEQAEESNRLKNAFIANMTHEIRTPMNAIVGFATLLADAETMERDEREVFKREITENKDALLQLVNDLLDFSKIESNSMEYHDEKVDVNVLIEEMCMAENAHPHKPEVALEFVEKLPSCRLCVDRTRFTQIVGNLLRNALKFTDEGWVRIGYRRLANGNFYFYVADTGCGIEEEGRQAIFDRFVKMNYNIRGTGLGLPITKSIVTHYGGGIGVDSKPGKGSTFYFTLPARMEWKEYGQF